MTRRFLALFAALSSLVAVAAPFGLNYFSKRTTPSHSFSLSQSTLSSHISLPALHEASGSAQSATNKLVPQSFAGEREVAGFDSRVMLAEPSPQKKKNNIPKSDLADPFSKQAEYSTALTKTRSARYVHRSGARFIKPAHLVSGGNLIASYDTRAPGNSVNYLDHTLLIEGRKANSVTGEETLLLVIADHAPNVPNATQTTDISVPVINNPETAPPPGMSNHELALERFKNRFPYEEELFLTKWGSEAYDLARRAALAQ